MNTKELCSSPYVTLTRDFLTKEEIDHLITTAKPNMVAAQVIDPKTSQSVPHEYRSGKNYFFSKSQDLVIKQIEEKIAAMTNTRIAQFEGIQVNYYGIGDEFKAHPDYLDDTLEGHRPLFKTGGQRIISVLMYLNTPEEGGETFFDALNIRVKPEPGSVLMWSNIDRQQKPDKRSYHGSRPVFKGEKWSATCWIRERNFDGSQEQAFEEAKAKHADNIQELKKKIEAARKAAIDTGSAELLAMLQLRGLRIEAHPQLMPDGRIGAYAEVNIDPESPIWAGGHR
jgi:2OG-Fe(II) oxygenase superfamily